MVLAPTPMTAKSEPQLKPTQNPVKTLNLSHAIRNCTSLAVSRERLVDNLASAIACSLKSLSLSVLTGDRNEKQYFIVRVSLLELGYWKFLLVAGRSCARCTSNDTPRLGQFRWWAVGADFLEPKLYAPANCCPWRPHVSCGTLFLER